jgi:tetratricopeptide (TPR) repeat protein
VGGRLARGGVLKGSAGGLYASQAVLLREGGAYGEMAEALMNAGDAFVAEGRFADAFGCYERAVNSWVAAGDRASAAGGVAKAVGLGFQLAGTVYEERIRLLRQRVGQ